MTKSEEMNCLGRDELFQQIKDKIKARTRRGLLAGMVVLILMIVWMIFQYDGSKEDMVRLAFSIVFCCIAAWIVALNGWLISKIGDADTPDRLLHYYKKKSRSMSLLTLVIWLVCLLSMSVGWFKSASMEFEYVLLGIVLVASVYLLYQNYKPGNWNSADAEMIERLQDLDEQQ